MATTCVLGHAWSEGMVLCPRCGFGRRNVPEQQEPAQVSETARLAATTGDHSTAAVQPATRRVAATVPAMASVGGPPTEQTLSPDGQWAWNGLSWVPAAPPASPASPNDETSVLPRVPAVGDDDAASRGSHRHASGRRARRRVPREQAAHRVDPRLLLGGVLLVAALVAADIALGLPPLGHQATAAPPVVVQRPTGLASRDAVAKTLLTQGATAETAYRAKSGLYTSSVAQLRTAGLPAYAGPVAFGATGHHGTGFCLTDTAGSTDGRWFLYDSVRGGLQPSVYPTEAAAAKGCSQTG